jgi:hypothetical protein
VPQLNGSTIRCRLHTFFFSDLHDGSNGCRLVWSATGDVGISESRRSLALRKLWTAGSTVAGLAPMVRIASQQTYAELHCFVRGDFASLSYVRGDQADKWTIHVNDQPVRVTLSLEGALSEFRREYLFTDKFILWVDALRINQNDLPRRAFELQ